MSGILMQVSSFAQSFSGNREVSAIEYCDFLNHAAASDPDHLYDEHMAMDHEDASIVRVGVSGQWQYEVIAGRENVPVTYVSSCNEACYFHWLQERLQATGCRVQEGLEVDDALKSNQKSFTGDSSAVDETLSLRKSTALKNSDSSFSKTWMSRLLFSSLCVIMVGRNYGGVDNFSSDSEVDPEEHELTELTPLAQRGTRGMQDSRLSQKNSSSGWFSCFSGCFEDSLASQVQAEKESAEALVYKYEAEIEKAKELGDEDSARYKKLACWENAHAAASHALFAANDHIESLKDKKNSREQTLLIERADQHEITWGYLFQKAAIINDRIANIHEDPVKDSAINLAIENSKRAIEIITRRLKADSSSKEEDFLELAVGEYKKSAEWSSKKVHACDDGRRDETLHNILGDSIKYSSKAAETFVEAANAKRDKFDELATILNEAAKKYQELPKLRAEISAGEKAAAARKNFDLVLQAAEDLMKAAEEKYKGHDPDKVCPFSTQERVKVLVNADNDQGPND